MLRSLLLALLFVFSFAHDAEESGRKVVVLEANEAPPFWSDKLPHDGMAGEIVHALSEAAGIDTRIVFKPLNRLINDDANNDLGNPIFFMLNQSFADIIPIVLYRVGFYYYAPNHQGPLQFRSIRDLEGMRIGVLKGALIEPSFFRQEGIVFEESYSHESLFKKLKLGRLDMVIEVELVSQRIIQRLFPGEMDNFVPIFVRGSSHPIAIMLAEEYFDAASVGRAYRKGLKKIIQNGAYRKIVEKYYIRGSLPERWFEDLEQFQQLYRVDEEG